MMMMIMIWRWSPIFW